ncbi:MAG: hypothetical protein NT096_05790 [Proteobacteria bacterium]|nr:hypothetical protein [Pseudomonadota bacterium]
MVRRIFNIGFWEQYIRNHFIKQIELLNESIQNRLIPTFDTIEKEAEEISEKEWDRLCSSCYSPDIDPADLAERAQEAGIDYYMTLSGIKQTLLNITATALYHLFEQQIIFFLRREVLHPSQENDPQLMKVSVFREQLLKKGIDIYSFRSWDKIKELRVVSNSIKHAEGDSASELRKMRPDMFKHPMLRSQPEKELMHSAIYRVYMPMAGDDIFVIQDDLAEYKNALVNFWNELIVACSNYEENMAT